MLVLRLTAPEPLELDYALLNKEENASWQSAPWEHVPALLKQSRQIVVLIPSREVLITTVTLKTRNQRQLAQALPFALEEQLMSDPEEQHYAHYSLNSEEGLYQVAIIEHARLQLWLDFLHHNGIVPTAILPDFMALPVTDGYQTAWLGKQGLWVRQTATAGYYTSASTWPLQLNQWLTQGTEEQPIHLRVLEHTPPIPDTPQLVLAYDAIAQTQLLQATDIQSALPLNVMKGFKTQAHSQLANIWQKWQGVAWVGAVTAMIALTLQGLEIRNLQSETDALQVQNIAQFKTLFPQAREIDPDLNFGSLINAEVKKLQLNNTANSSPSALPLLKILAQVLPQQPITLQSINWNQNKLTIRFTSESTAVIPELEKVLSLALKREVNINYQRDANKVVGEFNLIAEPVG